MSTDVATDARSVRSVIQRINAAWLEGPPGEIVERVSPCFDEDVVMHDGSFKAIARGRDALAKSFEDFVRMATVRAFDAPAPDIHVSGDAATAVCPWTMTYTLNGETYTETGHDLLVFRRAGADWRVMWRAMVPASA
jgi:hypothetical protein